MDEIDSTDYVLHDFVIGGDASGQGEPTERLQCYGVAGLPASAAVHLGIRLDAALARYASAARAKHVELHAKAIWNGHERVKGPFWSLRTKDEMKSFLLNICKEARSSPPLICVAFAHETTFPKGVLQQLHPKTSLSTALKRELVMVALSRLDDNLVKVSGKHIGRAKFLLDHESDQVFQAERGRAKGGIGFSTLSHIAYDKRDPSQPERWPTYVSLDPVYSFSHSESSRLIQLADVASYFVGKYFSLAATVLRQRADSKSPDHSQPLRDDLLFCLTIWNVLNIDVVLLVNGGQVPHLPEWLTTTLNSGAWRDPFRIESGKITYQCVLREARQSQPYNFNPTMAFPT